MKQHKSMTIAGWILTGLIVALMVFSGSMKLLNPPEMAEEAAKMGFPEGVMFYIGMVEIACVVIYLIPRTAVLGAILLAGYLGGAVETHVRLSDQFLGPAFVGVMVWLALYLREPRLRALVPWRKSVPTTDSTES